VAAFREWVAKNRPALEEIEVGLAALAAIRHLGRTCLDAGFLEELEGRPEAAAKWYLDCIRLGAMTRRNSMLIVNLVGMAVCQIGQEHLDRLVASSEMSEATLRQIIAACREAEARPAEELRVWKCEAAYREVVMAGQATQFPYDHPFYRKVREFDRVVQDILSRPGLDLLQKEVMDGIVEGELKGYEDVNLIRALGASVMQLGRLDVRLRATQIRAAIALYRERHGGMFPMSLDPLCPEILSRVPIDPFSGVPFRYARTEEGWKLWSVGHDNEEDGGAIDPEHYDAGRYHIWEGPDYVFISNVPSNLDIRSRPRTRKAASRSGNERQPASPPPTASAPEQGERPGE